MPRLLGYSREGSVNDDHLPYAPLYRRLSDMGKTYGRIKDICEDCSQCDQEDSESTTSTVQNALFCCMQSEMKPYRDGVSLVDYFRRREKEFGPLQAWHQLCKVSK